MTVKKGPEPCRGFTTGAAAAAAAAGALELLLSGRTAQTVTIDLLTGAPLAIPVKEAFLEASGTAVCRVVKDAGDDPDVTHRALIGARVRLLPGTGYALCLTGGEGVGRITRPGLEVPVGEPAINPGPRAMIRNETEKVLRRHGRRCPVAVEVFVPEGRDLARKTLNARLGILKGISILGTTGVVRPLSHEAYVATIKACVSVACAMGCSHLVLTTGRRSEKHAQVLVPLLPEQAFIQIGDFFGTSLYLATRARVERVTLVVFFGKALKMAQGLVHTHAARGMVCLDILAHWTARHGAPKTLVRAVAAAHTAREAFHLLEQGFPQAWAVVGSKVLDAARRFAGADMKVQGILLDYSGRPVWSSREGS